MLLRDETVLWVSTIAARDCKTDEHAKKDIASISSPPSDLE